MKYKNSLESFLLYSLLGVGIIYWWLGFEITVIASLGLIVGYLGKIYHELNNKNT
jgi:hypothetical protein